jgi:molybdate transport system ATP-binding protein
MPSEIGERVAVDVDVRHQLGTLALAATFRATAPWTVLFGPSGSGKSTILRTIAGMVRPDRGRVSVLGETVFDNGVWVPAHLRRVRWAGQRAALFPRETVGRNIAMGGDDGNELERCFEIFGLRELVGKRPGELSGGERQRVSVVRAAIGCPGRVLLLDEPFAGLDAGVRDELIGGLREWLGETQVISVTHDVGEAFLLGAEVVRVEAGKVVGQGEVGEVLGAERERLRGVLG